MPFTTWQPQRSIWQQPRATCYPFLYFSPSDTSTSLSTRACTCLDVHLRCHLARSADSHAHYVSATTRHVLQPNAHHVPHVQLTTRHERVVSLSMPSSSPPVPSSTPAYTTLSNLSRRRCSNSSKPGVACSTLTGSEGTAVVPYTPPTTYGRGAGILSCS